MVEDRIDAGNHGDRYVGAAARIMSRAAVQQGTFADQTAGDEAAALGLRRTAALAEALGRPQDALTIVHVAGTKGKGSTVAFISAMLVAADHRTGRYTSPHLAKLAERITIDEVDLDDEVFAEVADRVLVAADQVERDRPELGRVNALEVLFVMALVAFQEAGCRVAVIEVGIGGRLDTTNILDPAVSVITTLDLEHTAILGDTLAEIAAEKAGIVKPGRPVVVAPQPEEAMAVIRAWAESLGSRLMLVEQSGTATVTGDPGLRGPHQVLNALLATTALSILSEAEPDLAVGPDQRLAGLRDAWLPGRFEVVPADIVQEAVGDRPAINTAIVLDGAHTPRAAAALRATLEAAFPAIVQPVTICGFASDKDVRAFLVALRPAVILPVTAASPRAVPAGQIAAIARELGIRVSSGPDTTTAAVRWLLRSDGGEGLDLVLVTGSFMVVAEARAALGLGNRRQ